MFLRQANDYIQNNSQSNCDLYITTDLTNQLHKLPDKSVTFYVADLENNELFFFNQWQKCHYIAVENNQLYQLISALKTNQTAPWEATPFIKLVDNLSLTQLKLIEHTTGHSHPKTSFLEVLLVLQGLIEGSHNIDIDKIRRVITYIELMPIAYTKYFGSTAPAIKNLGDHLRRNALHTLNHVELQRQLKEEDFIAQQTPLQGDERAILTQLHHLLIKAYQQTWQYVYPRDATGQVSTPAIQEWQQIMIHSETKQDAAIRDFIRSVTIDGVQHSQTSIHAAIAALLANANAYSAEDMPILKNWLQRKGGQEMDRFIGLCLQNGELTKDNPGAGPTIGLSDGLKTNWRTEQGKLCLELDYFISSLQYGTDTIVNYEQKFQKFETLPPILEELFAAKKNHQPLANTLLSPLLRVTANIILDIEQGIVIPKVSHFAIHSFTDYLQPPTEKYAQTKITACNESKLEIIDKQTTLKFQ